MTTAEKLARENPTCAAFRVMTRRVAAALRPKLRPGFVLHRNQANPYGITIRKKRTVYNIWCFNNAHGLPRLMPGTSYLSLDKRTRKPRGITTDPDLKMLATVEFGSDAASHLLNVLREHAVVK